MAIGSISNEKPDFSSVEALGSNDVCPKCKGSLKKGKDGTLTCGACGANCYKIGDYIVDEEYFNPEHFEIDENGVLKKCNRNESLLLIGGKIKEVADDACYKIENLKTLVIGEGVKKLGRRAFQFCENLVEVYLNDEIEELDQTFHRCKNLQKVHFGKGLKRIVNAAFDNCENLREIEIPEGVEQIRWCFSSCKNLSSVKLPQSLKKIGLSTFAYCPSLKIFDMPKGVEELEGPIFSNDCMPLIRMEEGNPNLTLDKGFLIVNKTGMLVQQNRRKEIPADLGIKIIGQDVFMSSNEITELVIPEGVEVVGKSAFYSCEKLTKVVLPSTIKRLEDSAFQGCVNLKQINLPEGLAYIGRSCFENCTSLAFINLPTTVEDIGSFAFRETPITKMIFNDGLKKIGAMVFHECPNITTCFIPSSVEEIGNNMFNSCRFNKNPINVSCERGDNPPEWASVFGGFEKVTWGTTPAEVTVLREMKYCEKVIQIEDGVIVGATAPIKRLFVPFKARAIKAGAFEGDSNITQIYCSINLKEIGENAFKNCKNVNYVDFGMVEYGATGINIGSNAFEGCDGLTKLTVCVNVQEVGEEIFKDCKNLETVTYQAKKVGDRMFIGCDKLSSVTLENKVEEIGASAFEGITNLENVTFGTSVNVVKESAFAYTGIKNLSLVCLRELHKDAFSNCYNLINVKYAGNPRIIEPAFVNCERIISIMLTAVTKKEAKAWGKDWLYKKMGKGFFGGEKKIYHKLV